MIYEDIFVDGGGIFCIVDVVCGVFDDELVVIFVDYFDVMFVYGMMMVEVKIGYGFDIEIELWMFLVIDVVGLDYLVDVILMFMGVYVVLCGVDVEEYIELVVFD